MANIHDTGALPVQKTIGVIDPFKTNVVLHGPSGVGKTAFLAQFPDAYFIRTEERHKHVTIFENLIGGWEEFTAIVELLEAGHEYRTIVIDTTPRLYDYCMTYMVENHLDDHPGALNDHGKSWKAVRDEFCEWIVRLMHCNAGVWFICHTKTKEVKNSLVEGDTFTVDLPGQAYDAIIPLCDMTLFFGFAFYYEEIKRGRQIEEVETVKRILVCRPKGDIEAKDSLEILPEQIDMGKRPKIGYLRFIKYFNQAAKGEN